MQTNMTKKWQRASNISSWGSKKVCHRRRQWWCKCAPFYIFKRFVWASVLMAAMA